MLVVWKGSLFRQLENLGSWSKASVVRPDKGNMPDLAFKAPTCVNRDQSFFSTRQGGSFFVQCWDTILIIALTVRVLLGMDDYKNIGQTKKPLREHLKNLCSFKLQVPPGNMNEAREIDLSYPVMYPVS